MAYVILLAAVLMFTAQFAFTKIYGEKAEQQVNQTLIMLCFISLIGAVLYGIIGGFRLSCSPALLFWAVAFAVVMIPYYVLGVKVLSLGSVVIYSMFMMLGGMVLPFLYGLLFLNEPLTWGKGIGCVVLIVAICLQAVAQKRAESTETAGKNNLFIVLCIIIFVINGLTGVIAKAYQVYDAKPDEVSFTVVSCLLTALFSAVLLLCKRPSLKAELKRACRPSLLLTMTAIGITTYTGNFLHLLAAADLPASVQFPMVSGGVIVFSAIASVGIFKEKLKKGEPLCIIAACLSTLMFAF